MNTDKHDILRRFLDGELGEAELADAFQLFAGDPELRSLLHFEMGIRQTLAGPSSRVPDGFANKVMQSVDAMEEMKTASQIAIENLAAEKVDTKVEAGVGVGVGAGAGANTGFPGEKEPTREIQNGILEWLSGFFEPRQVAWRPVWSAGLALGMLMLVLLSSWATGLFLQQPAGETFTPVTSVAEQSADRVLMRFVYVDSTAESVAVAGDFSEWEPISLTRVSINGDQAWTGLIPLTRGEHRYMFIKDGEEWVTDPFAKTFRDDGFGNRNAVISL
ncbi:MAG: hypothetical protein ABR545_12585 [Cyclonatronaceae bacterium]